MKTKALPLLLLALLATPALAAPGPDADPPRPARSSNGGVMRYDTNKDGFVDRTEWNAGQDARFKQLDANNDGKLSKDEVVGKTGNERQEALFNRMDRDRDGVVTKAEFTALTDRNFARCDSDRDGKINATECRQALRRPAPADRASQQR